MMSKNVQRLRDLNTQAQAMRTIYKGIIDYKYFIDWPLGEERNLDGVCPTKKIEQDERCVRFHSALSPKSTLSWHGHDCQEKIEIIKGTLLIQPETISLKDIIDIPPYVLHEVTNTGNIPAEMYITFYKP